ncbi:hypothetical protein BU23DRAFT_556171 [Bimuria novae-zelandiae CBS 107.79]|uniref:Uncharacterized protein n=1 Tax=Bimuria novae-zelandiae CBS 107.79 TaxID=1447943 RepID=A0A6A5V1N3_9PLEO|nr:hypothetical protein BU23DRAFT_556171 [Bimuria novae-zelandiae CBS 107.79]
MQSENRESEREINAFAQANRRLYGLLNSYLYRYNIQWSASSALVWTAQHGQEATARRLLVEGANIEATGKYNWTPLLWAAKEGHEGIVKLLLTRASTWILRQRTPGGFRGRPRGDCEAAARQGCRRQRAGWSVRQRTAPNPKSDLKIIRMLVQLAQPYFLQ